MKVFVNANYVTVRKIQEEYDTHRICFSTGNGGYVHVDIHPKQMEQLKDALQKKLLLLTLDKQTKRTDEQ